MFLNIFVVFFLRIILKICEEKNVNLLLKFSKGFCIINFKTSVEYVHLVFHSTDNLFF